MNNLKKTYSVRSTAIVVCALVVSILAIFYWGKGNPNIGRSALESTETSLESAPHVSEASLQAVSRDKSTISINLLATSVQDNNAVVKIGSATKVVAVGDVLDSTGLFSSELAKVRVVQVAANQLVLKGVQKNNVYLVRMSKGGKPSVIETITSDIRVDMPHSRG